MAHWAAAHHARPGQARWLCADVLALPLRNSVFDGVVCIGLLHHRYSDAARQRILGALARVSRRFGLISFYRSTWLHTVARQWRGSRGRLAMLTFPHVRELAQASGLQIERVHTLLRFCHAQTFVVLTKTGAAGGVGGRGVARASGAAHAAPEPRRKREGPERDYHAL